MTVKKVHTTLKKREDVLQKLTGCAQFGDMDGMAEACVACDYQNPKLRQKCSEFINQNKLKRSSKTWIISQP